MEVGPPPTAETDASPADTAPPPRPPSIASPTLPSPAGPKAQREEQPDPLSSLAPVTRSQRSFSQGGNDVPCSRAGSGSASRGASDGGITAAEAYARANQLRTHSTAQETASPFARSSRSRLSAAPWAQTPSGGTRSGSGLDLSRATSGDVCDPAQWSQTASAMQSTASGSVTGTPPADRRWFSRGVPVSPSATRAGPLPAASEAAPGSAGPGDKAMGLAPATVASTAATSKAPSIEEPAQERAGAPPAVLAGSPGGPSVAPPVLGRHGNSRLGPRRGCSFGAAGFLSAEASQRVGRRLIRCSTGLLYEAEAVEPAPPVTPSGAPPSGAAARVPAVPAGAAALALAAGSGLRRGGSGGGLSPAASPMPTGTNRFVAPSPGLRTSGGSGSGPGPGPGPAAATTSAAAASPSPGFSARAARGLLSSGMRQSASAGAFNFNRASASDATDDTSVHSAGGNLRSSLSAGNSVISVASGSYVGLGATGPEDAALKLISCTLKASDVKRAPGARQGRVLTAEELGRKLLAEAEGTMTRVLLTRAAGGAAELSPPPPRGKGKGKFPTIAEDAGFSEAGTGPGAESSGVELEFRRAPGCGCVVM